MILQQLWADADAIMEQTGLGQLPPSMYVPKLLRWIVELRTGDDRVSASFKPIVTEGKKGERGIVYLLPERKRSGLTIRPFVLADTPAYVLGITIPDGKKDPVTEQARTALKHQEFKAQVRECAEKTGVAAIAAVARFLDGWDPENPDPTLPPDMTGAHTLAFRVNGAADVLTDDPRIQAFWASLGRDDEESSTGEAAAATAAAPEMQCLVSGVRGPVELNMPVAVRGVPGGQPTGTHLVSGNFRAMESYGLERSHNSPICRDAGERFGKSLNALLASERHKTTVGSVVYVYWTPAGVLSLPAFAPPDASSLSKFLTAVWRGEPWSELPDDTAFHIFGLTANAARVAVRSALDTTVGAIGKAQANWFERLAIAGMDGKEGRPLAIWQLAAAPYRDRKDIAPGVEDALVQAALADRPLPQSLLQSVVIRCRVGTRNAAGRVEHVTYERAALLKCLVTQSPRPLEEARLMSQEITGETPPSFTPTEASAYQLGRLFAELEDIQKTAIQSINAGIGDRYYGSASSSPASVFGLLIAGAQNHLSKLSKGDKREQGASAGAQRRLEEILSHLPARPLPKTLALGNQALFGLGYYHHRAAKWKNIADAKAARDGGPNINQANEDETDDQTENE